MKLFYSTIIFLINLTNCSMTDTFTDSSLWSNDSPYECATDKKCIKQSRNKIKKTLIIFDCDECVNSINHAQFILGNLYCISNRISRTLLNSLTNDLEDLYTSNNELLISRFTERTNDLENTILSITTNALNNIDTSAKSIIKSNKDVLRNNLELNVANMTTFYYAYLNQWISRLLTANTVLAITAALDFMKSPIIGAVPTLINELSVLEAANAFTIETSKNTAKEAIIVAINGILSITTLNIINEFGDYLIDIKAMLNNSKDIVSTDLLYLISKAEKVILCALENSLLGDLKMIEHLVRRCIEVVELRKVNQNDVIPLIYNGSTLQTIPEY